MFGKYKVIDAHCHIYPEKIASKAVGHTDAFYNVVSYCKGTVEDLTERGKKAGIDRFIVQSVATTAKQVESINRFIANEAGNSNGTLIGLGTMYPDTDKLEEDFQLINELGLNGIKLHPDIQGFRIDDCRCLKIFEMCEKKGLPVLIHTGDKRYDNSNPNRLIPILERFPQIKIIGAHFGGYSIWDDACRQLKRYPNLYVDCSSSFAWLSKDEAKRLIYEYGPEKVLFGTDYPMWNPVTEIKTLESLGLTEYELEIIFSKNAEKVYNL